MAFPSISEEELTPDLYFMEDNNEEEISIPVPHVQEKESGKEAEEDLREEQAGDKGPLEDATGPPATCGESFEEPKARSRGRTMNYTDRVRVLNLRRNLNQLDSLAKEKETMIQKNREELNGCHSRMELLTAQQRRVEEEIESEKEAGNTAAVFRLQAMHRRLCDELANEKDLESRIAAALNENMLEMWKIEIQQGNFSELRKQISRDEEELDQQRQEQAEERLQKQEDRKRLLSRRWLTTERKIKQGSKEYEDSLPQALEDAHQNHQKAVQFLKKSLRRVREKEASEELKLQEYIQRRMDTVLSLKNNITAKRENLQTLQACDKAGALLSQEQDREMEEALKAEGRNATREIFLQKRQAEFERRKKEFMEQQKARKIEIVSRILKEDAQLEKVRQESHPRMLKGRRKLSDASRWRMKTWRYIQEACGDSAATVTQKTWRAPSPCDMLEDKCYFLEGSQWTMPEIKDEKEEEDGSETLAEPEFTGIWDQECRISEVSDDRRDSKPIGATKLEKEIFAQNLEKLHSGVIRRHRVCGREFKGCPFYSKPSLVHFKDFDVGKTYKKKMVLINAFYSINHCKLVGVSEHLKDFFAVHFDPPGPMSAGMSCEVGVTFKPMINEDLEGEITFLSQIGSFSIPLKCSTKKCVLALDKEIIDFGTHVVGETISRTITLTNSGALGTRFQLCKSGSSDVAHAVTVLPSAEKMVCPAVLGIDSIEKSSAYSLRGFMVDKETVSPSRSEEVIQHSNLMPEKLRSDMTASFIQLEHFSHAASTIDITRGSPLPSLVMSSLECLWKEEIVAGEVTEGDIMPFGSVKLQINFTPAVPGDVQADFKILFANPDCKPLHFSATAVSMAVPVWVPNPDVDLKICMYGRLYQDCIVVRSRATSALRLKFDICKELANHMELLPKTGYIQAQSCFSVQLKFLPRHSLPEDAAKYFDEKTGVLEVPMQITVSDQSKPVEFTVHAIITTSDLEISPAELDFGHCSVYEAVQTTITITNKAMLPQEFGFVGLPAFVEIQPNDGFGILLPLESLDLDVIFKAKEAKEYSFQLTCKTEINRQFKLSCKAVGVHPPLQLSHSLVQFSATALNDVSTATLFVTNSHVSLNQFNHAGPRVGGGEVAPVGPTSFQFLVPEDAPITIMPCVGTVLPGKKCLIEVSFRPVLCDQLIRLEAVNLLCQAAENKALVEKKARELELQRKKEEATAGRKDGKKLASISFLGQLSKDKHGNKTFEPPSPEDICPDSEEYIAAHLSLVRSFSGRFDKYVIPCFVASGDIDEKKGAENLQYSPYNTLYLELHCPAVAPAVVVMSNNGKTVFNFGDVAIGHRIKKEVKIQNITQEQLTFFETLEIKSGKATLTLTLIGQGVIPSITCSVEGDVFNMGYVVAKETATATFKIENTSPLPLRFSIHLESLSPNRDREQQALPPFLTSRRKTNLVGTQNYSGLSVFGVAPVKGTIGLGKAQEFTVTFSPDHESLYYSDCIQVLLFGKEVIRVIQLKGAARNHMMFVEGGEPLDVSIESLAVTTSMSEELAKSESDKSTSSILLSLESVQSETLVIPAVRELKIGAIRTSQFASKKNVEFGWEGLQLLQLRGFTVDPVKGTVDRGQSKAVTVSWVPPAGSDLNQPVTGSATLVVKGDVKEIYSVYCMGRIVTKAAPAESKRHATASPDR